MDVTDANFGERIKRKLTRKSQHAARAERATAKAALVAQRAKSIEKIRSIARSGSSSFAPHLDNTNDDLPFERPAIVLPVEALKEERDRKIVDEMHKQRYRLSWRVAKRLDINEKLITTVLQTVRELVPQIDKEKRLMERWIKEIYAGKIEQLRRDTRGDAVRHDSRTRQRRTESGTKTFAVEL